MFGSGACSATTRRSLCVLACTACPVWLAARIMACAVGNLSAWSVTRPLVKKPESLGLGGSEGTHKHGRGQDVVVYVALLTLGNLQCAHVIITDLYTQGFFIFQRDPPFGLCNFPGVHTSCQGMETPLE